MYVNWRKWGFGFSIEFDDPAFLRLWIGPIRFGWKYGHEFTHKIPVEEAERIASEHGVAALLDHLGLEGVGEYVRLRDAPREEASAYSRK